MDGSSISLALAPKTLDYIMQVLAARPYAEVAQIIGEIAQQVQLQQTRAQPLSAGNGADSAPESLS